MSHLLISYFTALKKTGRHSLLGKQRKPHLQLLHRASEVDILCAASLLKRENISILFSATSQQRKVDPSWNNNNKKKTQTFHLGAQSDGVEGFVDLVDVTFLSKKHSFS